MPDNDDEYLVILDAEEMYSVWPAHSNIPLGWRAEGKAGTKQDCLAYISEVWTDMRPLSQRKTMEEARRKYLQEQG
ncbi:MAG: MbtH family NRPS accessory protein [Alphaproteobacteria bacterium]|nr:MbtH family NRPS accessory protein [Alphaproteobacteria bacterium]